MNKFYFQHRNIGNDPDTYKYYFSTFNELISQVELLKNTENTDYHFKWSISKTTNSSRYNLISEFWTTETRGTDTPLKCKGWFVCGNIYTNETNNSIDQIFSEWKADYTNHFIEIRYISANDFNGLSDLEKEKCVKEDGIILNKNTHDNAFS